MSSGQSLPTVSQLRKSFSNALVGTADEFADTITGSMYDIIGSVGAISFSKQSQRDKDLFASGYFDGAVGADLTDLVLKRFGIARILDTYGTGTAILSRPTATAGAGTIWTGTRVLVAGSGSVAPEEYVVASDTPVLSNQTQVTVPVHAPSFGSGYAVNAQNPPWALSVDDLCFDRTFSVLSINCADGTDFESDQDFKARVRSIRQGLRVGYISPIIQTCLAQGAVNIALFPSNYANSILTDTGLNYIYVGDQNYNGTSQLAQECMFALESTRVLGADCIVLPMQKTVLTITATVFLWDSPGKFNLNSLYDMISGIFQQYFSGNQNAFGFTLSGLTGAAQYALPEIQQIVFFSPQTDVTVTTSVNGFPHFPSVLPRYVLSGANVNLTFQGPQ
jgi:hypothetical protein